MPHQSPAFPRYRLQGFQETRTEEERGPAPATQRITLKHLMGQVVKAIPRPRLSDHLYNFPEIDKLAQRWPTLSLLAPRDGARGIRKIPMCLAEYLEEDLMGEEDGTQEILTEYQKQQAEQRSILLILKALNEREHPDVSDHPLAMAMACHLFAGSLWLHSHQTRIEELVRHSPIASYVALLSGAYAGKTEGLLAETSKEPALVLELSRSPLFRSFIPEARFHENLAGQPFLQAALLHLSGDSPEGYNLLHHAAQKDPLCAGVCLGLEPFHDKAGKWRRTAWESDEAIYWAGRIWKTANDDINKLPQSGLACIQLSHNPRWYYHWLRDFESQDLRDKVSLIWPDPWSVELIIDKNLSADVVLDLNSRHELEPEDPLEVAVALWAADFVTESNED